MYMGDLRPLLGWTSWCCMLFRLTQSAEGRFYMGNGRSPVFFSVETMLSFVVGTFTPETRREMGHFNLQF